MASSSPDSEVAPGSRSRRGKPGNATPPGPSFHRAACGPSAPQARAPATQTAPAPSTATERASPLAAAPSAHSLPLSQGATPPSSPSEVTAQTATRRTSGACARSTTHPATHAVPSGARATPSAAEPPSSTPSPGSS